MKLRLLAATVAALTLTAGLAVAQDTTSEKGKLSYCLGYDLGRSLAESGEPVDVNTLVRPCRTVTPRSSRRCRRPAAPGGRGVQKRQQAKAQQAKAAFDKAAAENKTKSDAFLAQNKAKSGVKVLPSGVQYRVIENGTGAKPTQASNVSLEVGGPYPFGQHPAQARPAAEDPEHQAQRRSSWRLARSAAADAGRLEVGSGAAVRQGVSAPIRARGSAERGRRLRRQAGQRQVRSTQSVTHDAG